LLPIELAPAEIEWLQGHALVIHRGTTRYPGPDDDSVAVLDRDGRQIFHRYPGRDIPGIVSFLIASATLAPNSTLTVAASAVDREGRNAQVLLQYDLRSGKLQRLIRTNPIWCREIAADSQNGIWCVGLDADKRAQGVSDFRLVHKYSTDGIHVAEFVDRGFFAVRPDPLAFSGAGYPKLISHGNEMSAIFPTVAAVFRWGLDGSLRLQARYPIEVREEPTGEEITMRDDGRLLAMRIIDNTGQRSSWRRTLVETVPGGNAWQRIHAFPDFPLQYHLIGVEGSELVLWDRARNSLAWFKS
jgi:hypothetical protein